MQRTRDNANPTRVPELLSSVYANTDEDRLRRMAPAADVKPSHVWHLVNGRFSTLYNVTNGKLPHPALPRGRFQRAVQAVFL